MDLALGLPIAPLDWYYHGFPLQCEGQEALSLDWVAAVANHLMDRAAETGDESCFGPVPHWAHLLKVEQGPEGDWPAAVNARTGQPAGPERTFGPALVLARLAALLQTTEFDRAIALARDGGEVPGR